jgi:hypothetical protein
MRGVGWGMGERVGQDGGERKSTLFMPFKKTEKPASKMVIWLLICGQCRATLVRRRLPTISK